MKYIYLLLLIVLIGVFSQTHSLPRKKGIDLKERKRGFVELTTEILGLRFEESSSDSFSSEILQNLHYKILETDKAIRLLWNGINNENIEENMGDVYKLKVRSPTKHSHDIRGVSLLFFQVILTKVNIF